MAEPDVERLMAEIAERWGARLEQALRRLGRRLIREVAENPALLDDLEYWNALAHELQGDLLTRAYEIMWAGAVAGEAAMGFAVDWAMTNQAVLDFTKEYGFHLLYLSGDYSIMGTTREQMREIFLRWQRGELGAQGMPDLVRALEPLFGPERAQRIATTETTRLYAQGNLTAWQISGRITHKIWHTARDELVCPICQPLDGVVVDLDRAFAARPVGAATPLGILAPPAHVNCRCWLMPWSGPVEETES